MRDDWCDGSRGSPQRAVGPLALARLARADTATQISGIAVMAVLFFTPHPLTHALLTLAYTAGTLFFVASFSYKLGEMSF